MLCQSYIFPVPMFDQQNVPSYLLSYVKYISIDNPTSHINIRLQQFKEHNNNKRVENILKKSPKYIPQQPHKYKVYSSSYIKENYIGISKRKSKQNKISSSFFKFDNHIPIIENIAENKPILLYFHANGQDIFNCHSFIKYCADYLELNYVIIEYPSYSLYRYKDKQKPIHQLIQRDSLIIYEYLNSKEIIVMGRSIGSGPAVYLAANRIVKGLILLCPIMSICRAVENIVGYIPSLLVKERFNNVLLMKQVKCRALIIHGQKDEIISYQHSEQLFENSRKQRCQLLIQKDMTHQQFCFQRDLLFPVYQFLQKLA